MKRIGMILPGIVWAMATHAQISIEECVAKAESNYPIIKKYGLIEATSDIDLAEINNSWLPRMGVYGQVTGQNVVPEFPKSLSGMLNQMGQSMKGLGKVQYRIGMDVSQNIWDGGASKARRELARSQEDVGKSALDVELYSLRQRVESVFFAILLTQEQIEQTEITYHLLLNNLEFLKAKVKNGVAMQSDADMIEAQALTIKQTISQAKSAMDGYRNVLELFIGERIKDKNLLRPAAEMPQGNENRRPELKLFESRILANNMAERLTNTSLMPKIGLFAQAYYGYPGLDYFKSMMNRDLTFNILAGIKASWNIDSFYSKKNNKRHTSVNALDIGADKDLFLFNNNIQAASQKDAIQGLQDVMKDDAHIIELRGKVRKAAESQLANGIIDATALLTKISDENIAQLNARIHEIQLIKEIYNLKYTLNQ